MPAGLDYDLVQHQFEGVADVTLRARKLPYVIAGKIVADGHDRELGREPLGELGGHVDGAFGPFRPVGRRQDALQVRSSRSASIDRGKSRPAWSAAAPDDLLLVVRRGLAGCGKRQP